ncbi:hypothetical protein AMET1_0985 [Methanonatronarchaeum thermophilum]|uniref:Uncharacterized protein n=1 Tax=Methanonatronarchaeum thermophilum TaxID=1927129 RepID=A0A1Y3GD59_9EURY|nr:hypothetical protein [Methanonatronarchaeum thermophilum]OUJ19329.1 hypothetical protein AMET1_0985 [Methanonatronarchaeum thermophilum]
MGKNLAIVFLTFAMITGAAATAGCLGILDTEPEAAVEDYFTASFEGDYDATTDKLIPQAQMQNWNEDRIFEWEQQRQQMELISIDTEELTVEEAAEKLGYSAERGYSAVYSYEFDLEQEFWYFNVYDHIDDWAPVEISIIYEDEHGTEQSNDGVVHVVLIDGEWLFIPVR